MRHGRHVKKLGVKTAHRHAMLANMAVSLILCGKVKTTLSRAKVLQSKVERLITLAKRGGIHARRQAFQQLKSREIVKKLFDEIGPELKNMNGGYTRRAFFGRRLGDGASMAIVELNIAKKVVAETKKKDKESAETESKSGPAKARAAAKEPKEKKPKAEKGAKKKTPAKAKEKAKA